MNLRTPIIATAGLLALAACAEQTTEPSRPSTPSVATASTASVGINIVLKARPTKSQLDRLSAIGPIKTQYNEINGVTLAATRSQLAVIRALPFVKAAAVDAEVKIAPPTDLVPVED